MRMGLSGRTCIPAAYGGAPYEPGCLPQSYIKRVSLANDRGLEQVIQVASNASCICGQDAINTHPTC